MARPLSIAAVASALATTAVSLACSDSLNPSTGFAADARPDPSAPTLTEQQSGTTNRLQAVSPVNGRVVWASGLGGTFTVTTNGGRTWRAGVVSGAEELQFRDVHGVSARVAYLLSAGPGDASRIYKTQDGGESWTLQFQSQVPEAFYDCFDFWDSGRGVTFSDAVDGRFPVILTQDGKTWSDIGDRLPPAQPGEAAFAASGTCVATLGEDRAWIATGAVAQPRVLSTVDGGRSWLAFNAPLPGGEAAGGFSVAFRDARHGMLVGGDLNVPGAQTDNVAVSDDGGKTWDLVTETPFPGAAFGASYVPGVGRRTIVATGPGGAAWSPDEGNSWNLLAGVEGYWAVAFAKRGTGWLVGTNGRILRIDFNRNSRD